MAGITYITKARAPLVTSTSPIHTVETEYSIDVKLQQFSEIIDIPKTVHVAIAGNTETVLLRATKAMNAVFIWPYTLNESMEEFLYSIAGGETFTFDPYGTVSVPDVEMLVVCVNNALNIGRMSHGNEPWRSITLELRPA